jgi:hypothetical protein
MNSLKRIPAALLAMAMLVACTGQEAVTTNNLRTAEGNTAIELAAGEKIATIAEWQADDLDSFVDCVEKRIRRANPAILLVSNKIIRPLLLPSLKQGKFPSSDEGLADLIRQPDVRRQIAKHGLRYLVILSGNTTSHSGRVASLPRDSQLSGQCSASESLGQLADPGAERVGYDSPDRPADLAQIGVGWQQSSIFFARVWDLRQEYSIGSLNSSATGNGAAALIILFPLVILPETGKTVCKEMGLHLAQFFSGGKLAEP